MNTIPQSPLYNQGYHAGLSVRDENPRCLTTFDPRLPIEWITGYEDALRKARPKFNNKGVRYN